MVGGRLEAVWLKRMKRVRGGRRGDRIGDAVAWELPLLDGVER